MPLSIRGKLAAFLTASGWKNIGATEWAHLRTEFPATSEATLRKHLHALNVPVDQPYAGISMDTLAALERSLTTMTDAYQQDSSTRQLCRATVIQAKDRARFASKNPRAAPEKRALKSEMLQWMLIWLDDPAMFPTWVALRKTRADSLP